MNASSFRFPTLFTAFALFGLQFLIFQPLSLFGEKIQAPTSDQSSEELENQVAYLLSLSEQELRDLVPVKSFGIWHTDCPNCRGGFEDRGRFEWNPEEPDRLRCEVCGEIYPENPKYPDDKSVSVRGPRGTHRFYYWEDPSGYRYFFRAHADYLTRIYLGKQIRNLAILYDRTNDDQFAKPAATLLHRFSEVVPGYAVPLDLPYHQKQIHAADDSRVAGSRLYQPSIWARWTEHDVLGQFIESFDTLYDWDGWQSIGSNNAKKEIENDLITSLVDFVLTFEDPLTAHSPRIWRDAIHAGRVLEEPKWIHESVDRFEKMLDQRFLYDGFWHETSPSAHLAVLKELAAVRKIASGYSDPENFTPKNGERFKNLDLPARFPLYRLAIDLLDKIRLPDGRLLPINRTWAAPPNSTEETAGPRSKSESFLLPGLGTAILGAGQNDQQIFSWLNFTAGTIDKHRDALSIGLFGNKNEVLADIGATDTRFRHAWAASTMAHNTAVVDGREQKLDENQSGQNLIAFATDNEHFHLAAAESRSAYPDRTDRYRRTSILVGPNSREAYLLDIFEIKGGERHDYVLHGDADLESNLELQGTRLRSFRGTLVNRGVTFQMPKTSEDDMGDQGAFSFIQNLRRGDAREPLRLDLRLKTNSQTGSRTLFGAIADAEVFVGNSPSIRPAAEKNIDLEKFTRPSFVVRREGQNLDSVFIAAHEAVDGFPRLHGIQTRLADDRIWVSIRHAGGRDYISIAQKQEPAEATFKTSKGDFTTDAAFAIIRLDRNDGVVSAHLVNGETLNFRNFELKGRGRFSGEIQKMNGEKAGKTSFEISERIKPSDPQVFIVEFPDGSTRAYNIARIEPSPGGTIIHVRESAGFRIGKNKIKITVPEREIDGSNLTWHLVDSAHSE